MSAKRKDRRIRDPIHDLITRREGRCDQLVWRLINTREFQRLRRIRQLGFSELTFPGATHSRLAHSIGVFNTARELLSVIEKVNPSKIPPKDEPRVCARHSCTMWGTVRSVTCLRAYSKNSLPRANLRSQPKSTRGGHRRSSLATRRSTRSWLSSRDTLGVDAIVCLVSDEHEGVSSLPRKGYLVLLGSSGCISNRTLPQSLPRIAV